MQALFDKAKDLAERIEFYAKGSGHKVSVPEPALEDLTQGLSHLYAEILYYSKEGAHYAITTPILKDLA